VTFEDWRNTRPADLAPCYAEEVRRWRDDLQWDFSSSIEQIEKGRREGRVGGFLVRDDDGAVRGWAYFVVNQRTLQIGALAAQSVEQLRGLLDHILRAPEAEGAQDIACFVYPQTAGLLSALERRRFAVVDFCYLTADATRLAEQPHGGDGVVEPFRAVPGPTAVRLLARSYAGVPVGRWFAPHGRLEEWAQYVGQLMHTPSCGIFLPEASFGLTHDQQLTGLVLTTQLSGTMAHVAQVAVDPDARGRGHGKGLVVAAARAARGIGCQSVSLLVADDNEPAKRLYASLGFVERGRFVSARRSPLRRTLSVERTAASDGIPSSRAKAS
jgi:GNAT superfamily N-acetyltransferase